MRDVLDKAGGMRALSLGPWVELTVGRNPCEGCAEMCRGGRYAKFLSGAGSAVLCGHDPCEWCAEIGGGCSATPVSGTVSGALLWCTICVKSVPT